jgi:hypothetical protein
MAFKHVLKSILEPKIPLVEIARFAGTKEAKEKAGKAFDILPKKYETNQKEETGVIPYIQINDYPVPPLSVEELTLNETGFIPTITVLINDSGKSLSPVQFPKRNMILSLYIKAPHEKLKPIRNDFIITSIRGSETLLIKGELFIPKMYMNTSKSYLNMNSKDTLYETCNEVQLGFQSNEVGPNDSMNWINPNWSSNDFMKHVISHSYQNDDSFFDGFIDKYYHFNYIDVNLQLEQDGEYDKTVYAGSEDLNISEEVQNDASKSLDPIDAGLVEHPLISEYYGKIIRKNLISNQGDILIHDGYKKRIYYYDSELDENDPMDKLISFYVSPIFSNNIPDGTKNLIPLNEELKNTEIKKWINIQYDNTHSQWNASKLINYHNTEELDKIKLHATVKGFNFNIGRGQRVPVGIYQTAGEDRMESFYNKPSIEANTDPGVTNVVFDKYISGVYYVSGNIYRYTAEGGIETEHILSKRNWKKNPVSPDANQNTNIGN